MLNKCHYCAQIASLECSAKARSEAPRVRKFGYLWIQEIWVLTKSPYVHPPVHVSECEMSHLLAWSPSDFSSIQSVLHLKIVMVN